MGTGNGYTFSYSSDTKAFPNGQYLGSDGNKYALNAVVNVQAGATWTFRPNGSTMQVTLSAANVDFYQYAAGLSLSLSDVTHPGVLLAFSESETWQPPASRGAGPPWPPIIDVTEVFNVSTSDTYQLTIAGWADTYDDDYAQQNVWATVQVIPEPSAFGLCLLGLLSIAGFKRWR